MIQQTRLNLQTLSPAFLGDAQQSAVWRTPPIKALLREWWRVASASTFDYGHRAMREAEGLLFGNAWLEPKEDKKSRFCKSQVRMALAHWSEGKMRQHTPLAKVPHPEAEKAGKMVEPLNYLGYGPIDKGQFKNGAALQANEPNTLDLAWPGEHDAPLNHTLQLIDWFGTFGGRSRNGWGSLALGLDALTKQHAHLQSVLRPLADCLHLDWPHALGKDGQGPLIWESSETFSDWQKAMQFLARTKIGFRTNLGFTTGKGSPRVEARHIVAYPVTNHDVRAWGGQARLANQLRFKLFHDPAGHLRARIYHTPHKSPLQSGMSEAQELAVWQKIHTWLDRQASLARLGAES